MNFVGGNIELREVDEENEAPKKRGSVNQPENKGVNMEDFPIWLKVIIYLLMSFVCVYAVAGVIYSILNPA